MSRRTTRLKRVTRTKFGSIVGPGPWCGTSGGYTNHLCRCDDCTEAWRVAHADYIDRNPIQRDKNNLRERMRYWAKRSDWGRVAEYGEKYARLDRLDRYGSK